MSEAAAELTLSPSQELLRESVAHAAAWAKRQPTSRKVLWVVIMVAIALPAIIYGKMYVTCWYYILFELWPWLKNQYHAIPPDWRHGGRAFYEGLLGGLMWQQLNLNAFARKLRDKWLDWADDRLTLRYALRKFMLLMVISFAIFGVGFGVIWLDRHNMGVHNFVAQAAPSSLGIHINLSQFFHPGIWTRVSAVLIQDLPLMIVGFIASLLARPRMTPVFYIYQGYRAAKSVLADSPDRWWMLRGYCTRKEQMRYLMNTPAGAKLVRSQIDGASRVVRIFVGAFMWSTIPAFPAGLFILMVIAQHSVLHIGHITLS